MITEFTKEEMKAIKSLQRLEKSWPKSLWLFTNGQRVYILKCGTKGERVYASGGGVDPEYVVATAELPSEGGDW